MTPGRRAALIAATALLLGGLWWIVRAPAMGTRATPAGTSDADVDLDQPALRERREAARKIATMPDDPWTLAESLAASAPGPVADKGRCGDGERPQFDDPEVRGGAIAMDQTRAAGPHYLAARAAMDAALRASADPFDRAVADWLDVGQMRTPEGRVDALVQQALAGNDARVYALALRSCLRSPPPAASCGVLSATRWAELDPGNGVPWAFALNAALQAHDVTAQKAALAGLAAASRFDERAGAAAAAIAAHAPDDDGSLAAVVDLSVEAIGRTLAQEQPLVAVLPACRPRAGADAAQCQAIADTMFDHTDSLMLRSIAGGLQYQLTRDDTRRKLARAELQRAAEAWSPDTGFSSCQAQRDVLRDLRRRGEIGEVEAMRERTRAPARP